jgi:hypothetical protein
MLKTYNKSLAEHEKNFFFHCYKDFIIITLYFLTTYYDILLNNFYKNKA